MARGNRCSSATRRGIRGSATSSPIPSRRRPWTSSGRASGRSSIDCWIASTGRTRSTWSRPSRSRWRAPSSATSSESPRRTERRSPSGRPLWRGVWTPSRSPRIGRSSSRARRPGAPSATTCAVWSAARRAAPSGDLMGLLITLADDDGLLSDRELVAMAVLVAVAGTETTTSLIGTTVWALLSHPEALAGVREAPWRLPAAIEETLRWESPVQRTWRIAKADVELAGQRVPAGALVVLLLGGANRDPARFPGPTNSTSIGGLRATSPSAPASTPAWALRSRAWRRKRPSRRSCVAGRVTGLRPGVEPADDRRMLGQVDQRAGPVGGDDLATADLPVCLAAHWPTLPPKERKRALAGDTEIGVGPRSSSLEGLSDRISWYRGRRRQILTAVTAPGFGESHVGLPFDGQHETRSPESNPERPRPATGCSARSLRDPERQSVSDRQDLSTRSVSRSEGGTQ